MIHRSSTLLVVACVQLSVAPAHSASIGLFSTTNCNSCNLVLPSGWTDSFYIRANTEGVAPGIGFDGAGLRISGLPDGWSTISVPNPLATVSTGDPFGPDGARIAFPASMLGRCIDLYTVTLTATTAATEVRLQVVGVTSAWSPDVICPLFTPGCRPCDFDFCVGGGSLLINSTSECLVALEAVTWAGIKSLFR